MGLIDVWTVVSGLLSGDYPERLFWVFSSVFCFFSNGQKYKGVSCIEYTLSQMGKWRVAALGDVGKYLRCITV